MFHERLNYFSDFSSFPVFPDTVWFIHIYTAHPESNKRHSKLWSSIYITSGALFVKKPKQTLQWAEHHLLLYRCNSPYSQFMEWKSKKEEKAKLILNLISTKAELWNELPSFDAQLRTCITSEEKKNPHRNLKSHLHTPFCEENPFDCWSPNQTANTKILQSLSVVRHSLFYLSAFLQS